MRRVLSTAKSGRDDGDVHLSSFLRSVALIKLSSFDSIESVLRRNSFAMDRDCNQIANHTNANRSTHGTIGRIIRIHRDDSSACARIIIEDFEKLPNMRWHDRNTGLRPVREILEC